MEQTVYDIETKLPYELGLRSRIRNRTSGASSAMSRMNYDALDGSQWKDVVEFDQIPTPKSLFTKTEKSKSPVIPHSCLFYFFMILFLTNYNLLCIFYKDYKNFCILFIHS